MRKRELFLVVFCCVLLLCLLTGAAGAAQSRCGANLHKLYQAMQQYEKDYGALPPAAIRSKPKWQFYFHAMREYLPDRRVLACPADEKNRYLYEAESPLFSHAAISTPSYGMNYAFAPEELKKYGIRKATLKVAGDMILLVEGNAPYIKSGNCWKRNAVPRHNGKAAILFADGSVEFHTEKTLPAKRWNWRKK